MIRYRQVYLNRPDPIAFMTLAVDTSGSIYDDFSRLLFFHAHRETSTLANELNWRNRVVSSPSRHLFSLS